MKNKATGFVIVFILAFAMASCGEDEIVTRYVFPGLHPEPARTLQELIDFHGGVHYQNHVNISLRFFPDGTFQRWSIGLGVSMQAAGTSGNRYRIDGDRIFFYFDPVGEDPATTPRHSLSFRMEGTNLIFVEGFAGTAAAPTDVFTRPATVTIAWDDNRQVNTGTAGAPVWVTQPGYVSTPSTELVPQIFTIGPIPDFQGW